MTDNQAQERHKSLGTLSNLRDVGGYTTVDGKFRTRYGRLYRSDHLGKVPVEPEEMNCLTNVLGIGYSVDFRSGMERNREPYHIPCIETTVIAIEPGDVFSVALNTNELTEATAVDCMVRLYAELVTTYKSKYAEFFRLLTSKASADEKAVVFHCTAGKDRTGVAAALVLLLLDVPVERVYEDYLLTNLYFKPPPLSSFTDMNTDNKVINEEGLKALFYVRREYLENALATIHKSHPDVRTYVQKELGVSDADLQKLRDHLLEPVA